MTTLPTPESFLADFGFEAPAGTPKVDTSAVKKSVAATGVSKEFADLLTQYAAAYTSAYELSQVKWGPLAQRLGTQPEFLAEAAALLDQEGALWQAVLGARIKKASAAKIFRDSAWEQLEALAVNRLMVMAEKNLIRDPGELLAVASHARRANEAKTGGGPGTGVGGTTVNINMGAESMDGENGLPAAGAKMTIDLSPRVAGALAAKREPSSGIGGRVIDGQMLSAQELRGALEAQRSVADADSTEETQDGTDVFAENG